MDYVRLGRTGLKVSRICLGCMSYGDPAWRDWVLPEEAGRPFIQRALELGINFFDTANMYSRGVSEEILGRALKDFTRRDEVMIATKLYFPMGDAPNARGLSRKHVFDAIDASLRRLGVDHVDLYQIHRFDPETPIEETLEALHDLVRAGKLLYTADLHGWTRFVSMQNHYNLAYREEEREMLLLCREEGIGVLPWSPLARGFLAGNRRRCEKPARIALAWLLHQPGVTAPHRGRHARGAPGGRGGGAGDPPFRGGAEGARRAVQTAPGARARVGAGGFFYRSISSKLLSRRRTSRASPPLGWKVS